ncbi:MAG: 4Fe-4S binding protein [Promethearchaeati archaeon SRVP18_Atabeyarchaeia-1]
MKKETKDWTKDELMNEYVGKYTPLTIPVDISIEGQQTILNLTRAEKILDDAKVIAVEDCGCRTRMRKCDAPLEVCLSLDDGAKEAIESGARKISKSQALAVMRRSHEAGLVHLTYTIKGQEKPFIICSCCSCCCHSLSALVRFGIPDHVVASEYIASDNEETCDKCGTCVRRCQFHARQLVNGKVEFDQSRCYGCGVCVTTCPTKSIKLITRKILPTW